MKKQIKTIKKQSKNNNFKSKTLDLKFIVTIKNSFKLRKKSWLFFIIKLKKYLHIRKRPISRVKKTKIHSRKVGEFRKVILPLYFGWELMISVRRIENWEKQLVGPFKQYWHYMAVVVLFITLTSASVLIYQSNITKAATYDFIQTDWSGGATVNTATHSSNQSSWDEYISKDSNITAGTEIVLTEGTTSAIETSDTDFNAGTTTTASIVGSGDGASVYLGSSAMVFYNDNNNIQKFCSDPFTDSVWITDLTGGLVSKFSASSGSLTGTYGVFWGASACIFDSSTNSIWVAKSTWDEVTKLSAADGSVIGSYSVGQTNRDIAFDSSTNSIWVPNLDDDTVTKLSAADGSVTGTYSVGDAPYGIVFDSSTNSIWVTNYNSANVTKLSAADGSVTGTYSVGNGPRNVAFDSSTNSIWVVNYLDGTVTKLSAADGSVTGTYSVGFASNNITFDSSSNSLWVSGGSSYYKLTASDGTVTTYTESGFNTVKSGLFYSDTIWATAYDAIVQIEPSDGTVKNLSSTGDAPRSVVVDSSTNSIWVANYNSDDVTKISAADGSVTGTYSVGNGPRNIAFDSSTNSIWVTNYFDNTVTKLLAVDGSLIDTYAVGAGPIGVTFDSSTNSIWVANYSDDTVTKLLAVDGSVIDTYSVGDGPYEVVFDSFTNSVWTTDRLANTVTKLLAVDGSVTGTYSVGSISPSHITFDSYTNSIWTSNYSASSITKISAADGSVTGTYTISLPYDIVFDSSTNSIWVAEGGNSSLIRLSVADGSRDGRVYVGDNAYGVAFDPSTNSIWASAEADDTVMKTSLYSYSSPGTFTSQILDTNVNSGFSTASWTSSAPTNTTLTVKIRTDSNSDMSGATAWSSCTAITSGNDITSNGCVTDGHQYVQYQVSLASSDSTVSSSLDDISIQYNSYSNGSLLGSPYNTESDANLMSSLSWTESGTGDVQFQLRTAPDSGGSPDWANGSGWCGSSTCAATAGDTDYASSYHTTSASSAVHTSQDENDDDQWFQYRLWLTSADGLSTPALSDLTVVYVVNAPPDFENTITATQGLDGLVTIDYSVRDPDADSGSNTIIPSFQYSINNGDDWNDITTGLSSGATTTITGIDQVTYDAQQITWTPGNLGSYTTTAKIRVTVDDSEAANNTTSSDSIAFTMDAKAPTVGAVPIIVVASTTPASIFLDASDDTALEMCISLVEGSESNCVTYNTTSTIAVASDPDTVYTIFKDSKSNTTSVNAVTPEKPYNMIIRDISNVSAEPDYRLFVSWAVVTEPGPGFANYEIWHSTDGSSYSLLTTITDKTINYYLHDDASVTADSLHYYKVYTTDDDGNTSRFSDIVSDIADGQGGTDASPPTISDVSVGSITTQSAVVTWTTDELSDSTVGYGDSFATESGVASMVTAHSVTITDLTPGGDYAIQIQSADPDTNEATDNNGGGGYLFSALDGPAISNTGASIVQNTAATITWNTDIEADSTVYYSINADMSGYTATPLDATSVTEHLVTIPDSEAPALTVGTKYYFYVASGVAIDNNGGEYYYFNTTSDTVNPIITDVDEAIITDDDIVVTWTTDEGATSRVAYGVAEGVYDTYTTSTSVYNTSHSVTLTPLINSQLYYYSVSSADSAGNTATSTEHSTTTLEQLSEESDVVEREEDAAAEGAATVSCGGGGGSSRDTRAPTISDVLAEVVASKATISWSSNENGISIINYGIDDIYENSITDPQTLSSPSRSHSISIDNLIPNITYKYEVIAIDSSGNVGRSAEETFTSGEFSLDIGTGEDGEQVGEEAILNSISQATKFFEDIATQVSLSSFENGVYEHITDLSNIIPPPIISGEPLLTISSNSASISWTTDDEANALVSYATEEYYLANNDYQYTMGNPDLYLAGVHKVDITGLEAESIYHYRIKSQNRVGSTSQSRDFIFTTIPELAEIENYTTEIVSSEEVVFKWITTVPTDSNLKYTPYRDGKLDIDATRTESNDIFTTIHNIRAENLEAGVLYQVELYGDTISGNTINQIIPSFATSDDNLAPIIKQVKTDAALSFGKETKVQAIISWYTNEPSTSRVYYEKGAGRSDEELTKSSPIDENFARHHVVVITSFNPGSIYRFQVESVDGEGNASRSRTYTILTPKQQESVFQVIMKNVETSFGWLQAFK